MDYTKIIKQAQELEKFVSDLPPMDKVERRKAVGQFSFKRREENGDFVYWSVLNSGPAGETPTASPTKKQKEMYNLFKGKGSMLCFTIDFNTTKTVFWLRSLGNTYYTCQINHL